MTNNAAQPDRSFEIIVAELTRIGLRYTDLPGLAGDADAISRFIDHLRRLPVGATWPDVFPGRPLGRVPGAPNPERSLGPFDYQESPRGAAVFASVDEHRDLEAATRALAAAGELGIPFYGSGLVLDRGHPHMYIVFPLSTLHEHVEMVADFLRIQPGIAVAYCERDETPREHG